MFAQSHSDRIEIQSLHFENGQCRKLSIFFGPHHFFEVETVNGKTVVRLGATHHGIEADASSVPSQLESFIEELRQAHPESVID